MSLREAWDGYAEYWIQWARHPGHDSYSTFHRDRFFELLPPPGRLTLDLGAGEGRLGRDLRALGHTVVELDGSLRMARASHELTGSAASTADMARVPFRTGAADLVVSFMALQDVDAMPEAVAEMARILEPGSCAVLAMVHPINSGGKFARTEEPRPFVMTQSYFERRRLRDEVERDGLAMVFESEHRPLEAYSRALEAAGFVIEALREVTEPDPDDKWHRMPLFLDLRARRL